jgi:hypothetical protein
VVTRRLALERKGARPVRSASAEVPPDLDNAKICDLCKLFAFCDRATDPHSRYDDDMDDSVKLSAAHSKSLVAFQRSPIVLDTGYDPPRPGNNWRAKLRTGFLIGGSMMIGAGAALGYFGFAASGLLALSLASGQVLAQIARQNRLGQDVLGGIATRDLEKALRAGEKALEEAPSGAMRTLAAANLASVLMQLDRIDDGGHVLDLFPPRWPHVPVATILWKNNRAFAHLARMEHLEKARPLLDDAEERLRKAGIDGAGGTTNFNKISSALFGTRALQLLRSDHSKEALNALERSRRLDQDTVPHFRSVERDLCQAEALRRLNRADEALLIVTAMQQCKMTERQKGLMQTLEKKLGLQSIAPEPLGSPTEWF